MQPSSETQGQIVGTMESLNGWKYMAVFSGTNQNPERRRPFGTGLVRLSPGALLPVLYFSSCHIIFRPFRLSLVPTICPWVSEDEMQHVRKDLRRNEQMMDNNNCLIRMCTWQVECKQATQTDKKQPSSGSYDTCFFVFFFWYRDCYDKFVECLVLLTS